MHIRILQFPTQRGGGGESYDWLKELHGQVIFLQTLSDFSGLRKAAQMRENGAAVWHSGELSGVRVWVLLWIEDQSLGVSNAGESIRGNGLHL